MTAPATDRQTDTALDSLFLHRWSPRAFDRSEMPEADLMTIFDAGRWAPSAYNYQPWRFLYARRGDANWQRFLDVLVPFNQSWAKDASALVYLVSEKTMGAPDKPNHTHSFDTGAAWGMMALQARMLGYITHGMSGIDFERASRDLGVPEGCRLDAAFVIGKQGDISELPDNLRDREVPSDRKPLSEVVVAGPFPAQG